MFVRQWTLVIGAVCFVAGCTTAPSQPSQSLENESQLVGLWDCRLKATEISTNAIAQWTESLGADGDWSGQGVNTISFGEVGITAHFSGAGEWLVEDGVYQNDMESADVRLEGDPEVIERLNQDKIRRAFLEQSREEYTLKGERWVRHKSGTSNVTVCQRAG